MGHVARHKIQKSEGRLTGQGMALAGLIMGYVFLVMPAISYALLLPTFSPAKTPARKAAAKSDVTQIVSAVKSYYTDYGVYPISNGAQSPGGMTFGDGKSDNKALFDVLRAIEQGNSINTRKVVYLDVPQVRNLTQPKSGIGGDGNWYDPWGRQYIIRIDSGYTGKVGTPDNEQLNTGVIAWSLGPDGNTPICSWK